MSEGTHVLIGVKSHSRFVDGSPVRLVPGTVLTPTPQELAAFPEKFEPVSGSETKDIEEVSPDIRDEFLDNPEEFVQKRNIPTLIGIAEEGTISASELLEAEELAKKPRVTLVNLLGEM